jgi:O-succinylbenzoic acid--CoA ligase
LKSNKFHNSFKLQGHSFNSKKELLETTASLSEEVHDFFVDWFSEKETLTIQTSGSTGTPKLIQLSKAYMINSAKVTGGFFELSEGTTALLCLPVRYIAGKMMLVRALVLGWHLDILPPESDPLRKINKAYDFSAMIPLQLRTSLDKIHLVKKLIVGGGAVDVSLENAIQNLTTEIYATYGMTETITHIAVKKLNHSKWDYFKALPEVKISIDTRGCLIIDAPGVSSKQIITNDIVEIHSDVHFSWKGRYDNVVNSGGIKLHPEEIEKKIAPYLDRRFFVSGIKDEVLGERLILVIEGIAYTLPEKLYQELTKFETPKEVFFVADFEETETGKVQRTKTLRLLLDT